MLAATLSDLLEELKYAAKSRADVDVLAKRYDIDVETLRRVTRFVNTPTVDPSSVARSLTEDGEVTTMKVRRRCVYLRWSTQVRPLGNMEGRTSVAMTPFRSPLQTVSVHVYERSILSRK